MRFTWSFTLAAFFASLATALPAVPRSESDPSASASASSSSPSSASSAPSVSPSTSGSAQGGGVTIRNNLDFEVYMWIVGATAGEMRTLQPNGGTYSQSWLTPAGGGGVSIKLATEPELADVLQFEYTLATPTIFWDLSCIDMKSKSKFSKYGFAVKPSLPGGSCPSAICRAGDEACADAYLVPTDDEATHGCPAETHLEMEIGQ